MMLATLGIRLLLAVVFAAAALAKLRARDAFAQSLTTFAVPRAAVGTVSRVVPVLELATAVALVSAAWARPGAALAIVLLALFTSVIGLGLLLGHAPTCACFGAAAAETVDGWTLARNGVLMALAAIVLLQEPGGEMSSWFTVWGQESGRDRTLAVSFLTALVLLAALWLRSNRLKTDNATLTRRVATLSAQVRGAAAAPDEEVRGLPVGTAAPPFDLPRLEGDRATLASLCSRGRPVALLFLSAHCPACHELWSDIARWQARHADAISVAAVCSGSPQTIEMKVMGFAVSNVLLEGEAHVGKAYALALRPAAVLVDPSGRIASPSVAGVGAIRSLVERSVGAEEVAG